MLENTGSASPTGASEGAADFRAPTIGLPQGGGAIRGIDEKFAANPVTGAGALRRVGHFHFVGLGGFGSGARSRRWEVDERADSIARKIRD